MVLESLARELVQNFVVKFRRPPAPPVSQEGGLLRSALLSPLLLLAGVVHVHHGRLAPLWELRLLLLCVWLCLAIGSRVPRCVWGRCWEGGPCRLDSPR